MIFAQKFLKAHNLNPKSINTKILIDILIFLSFDVPTTFLKDLINNFYYILTKCFPFKLFKSLNGVSTKIF